MRRRARLLVFEGANGVGKSTLSRRLVEDLSAQRWPVRQFAFPGHLAGSVGQLVYQLHHDSAGLGVEQLHPTSLQLMHIAAHVDAIFRMIRPALLENNDVVLDRFWWSTWVYGTVAGISDEMLWAILKPELLAWKSIHPAAIFLVEREDPVEPKLKQISEQYRQLRDTQKQTCPVFTINNKLDVQSTMMQIKRDLDSLDP